MSKYLIISVVFLWISIISLSKGYYFALGGAIAGWVACVSDMRALGSWAVANRGVVVSGLIFISLLLVIFGI
ncbi:hypothetical protein C8C93_1894 [Acidovorax sp. 93]|jgi:hypothetical protein|uniref:hypothetical protein n=1 Tax=Acidovorax TaxID=12916 RepID=UPI000F1AC7BF|nr:hypothetical protein [Acidovorax sp. 93]RKR26650.1 hypothetical protein C8C93_1894 [Acidovorax sp. 93]